MTWLMSGDYDGRAITLLYVGRQAGKNFFCSLFFKSGYSTIESNRLWSWRVREKVKKAKDEGHFAVVDPTRVLKLLLPHKECFQIPHWIDSEVDLSVSLDVLRKSSKSAANNIRRIERNNLSYLISKKPEDFPFFYHHMYLPYITQRHGGLAVYRNYNVMKRIFEKGEILFVTDGNLKIAGSLISYEKGKDRPALMYLGVLDSKTEYVDRGAISAVYYYAISHYKANKHKRLWLGGSRAFIKDGILRFKLKNWHAQLIKNMKCSDFLFFTPPLTGPAKQFLKDNPFMVIDKESIFGIVFEDACQFACENDIRQKTARYCLPGFFPRWPRETFWKSITM